MDPFWPYFISQKTEIEVSLWAKCNPDGQPMWFHSYAPLFWSLVKLWPQSRSEFTAFHWEDLGSSTIFFIFFHSCGWNTPKEIIGVFALVISFFLWEGLFWLSMNSHRSCYRKQWLQNLMGSSCIIFSCVYRYNMKRAHLFVENIVKVVRMA